MAESVWPYLQKRFPSGQYALLQEVSDAAGFSRSRSADGIAMSLWPSRGLGIEGIEVKSFRSDWLRELKDPKKAENVFKYCDRWWLVTADDNVAKMEEIPLTWGWMTVKGKRMITIKEAPALTPIAVDKTFIAAMMKRATQGMIPIGSIQDKIEEVKKEAKEQAEKNQPYEIKLLRNEVNGLRDSINQFQEASGIEIGNGWRYDLKKIGEAAKFIAGGGLPKLQQELLMLKSSAERICKGIERGLEGIDIIEKKEVDEDV
jgi:hypothetical protein